MNILTPIHDGIILSPESGLYSDVQTWANLASNFLAPIVLRTKRDGTAMHRARVVSLDGRHAVYFASVEEFKTLLAAIERRDFFQGRKVSDETWESDSAFADEICATRAEATFARDFAMAEPVCADLEKIAEEID